MDHAETKPPCGRVSAASRGVLCLLVGLLWASGLRAQSPDEHASHHPGQAGGAMPATPGALRGWEQCPQPVEAQRPVEWAAA